MYGVNHDWQCNQTHSKDFHGTYLQDNLQKIIIKVRLKLIDVIYGCLTSIMSRATPSYNNFI